MATMVSAKLTNHTMSLCMISESALEANLRGLERRLERRRADEARQVIADRIDVSARNADGQRHLHVRDRIPGGSLRSGEGVRPRQLGEEPRDPAECGGRLRRSPAKGQVVLHRGGVGRANVADGIRAKGISVEGLGVDNEGHSVSTVKLSDRGR